MEDTSGANDSLSATTLQRNSPAKRKYYREIIFHTCILMGLMKWGTSVRLRFYAAGRYFGNFTTAQAAAGYQNGDNAVWTASNAQYIWQAMLCLILQDRCECKSNGSVYCEWRFQWRKQDFVTRRGQPTLDGTKLVRR